MKNKNKIIPLSEPFFFGNEKQFLKDCITSGWITTSGKYLNLFENEVKKITKSKYLVPLINGTSALQLALRCLNPSYQEEVLVPSITFIATINAIKYNNCSPVFMDCDDSFLIDLNKTLNFLKNNSYKKDSFTYNKKTKKKIIAIIVVHTFGNCVNLNKKIILAFKKYNIKVIEDAAESFGSYLKIKNSHKHSGTIGDLGCFSFNGNKVFTAGGGGMVTTKNKSYYKKILYLSNQAKDDPINFIHNDVGYNLRMSNLHASVGLGQIINLKKIIAKKKEIHRIYKEQVKKINGYELLTKTKNSVPNYWLNILKINKFKSGSKKDKLIKYLLSKGIAVRSVWFPNHLQQPYLKYESYNIKKSPDLCRESICLPSSYSLTIRQIKFIINTIVDHEKKN